MHEIVDILKFNDVKQYTCDGFLVLDMDASRAITPVVVSWVTLFAQ